jgi:hypothetical protein
MTLPATVRSFLSSRRARLWACVALIAALAPIADLVEHEPADARPYAGQKVTFEVAGAQGGGKGGQGAIIQATAELTPGSTVTVTVGGTDGFNGGGAPGPSPYSRAGVGGGASDLRIGGTTPTHRVLVAAGGGGRGGQYEPRQPAGSGGPAAATGNGGDGGDGTGIRVGLGGYGATSSNGGRGGGTNWCSGGSCWGSNGVLGAGGRGGTSYYSGGGGGGGGFYGGGGGGAAYRYGRGIDGAGGGGGGSSYVDPVRFPSGPSVADSGARSGDGRVRISLDGGATWVATYDYSRTVETYTVPWAPLVDRVDTKTGPTTGGTSVTLTGRHLGDVTAVSFCGNPGTGLAVESDTTVTVATPAGSIGPCDVVLQTHVSGSTTVPGAFRYYAVPVVETASPAAGPLSGGTLDLTGTGFSGTEKVTIGGQKATFSVNSDTSITVTAPPAAAGEATIAVTTKDTTGTGPATFTYVAAPTITGVAPPIGPADGGASVTITGTHFGPATSVDFGATPAASFTVDSATQITAIAPALDAGPSDVSITTPGGTAVDTDGFRAYARPAITGLSSPIGPSAGGGTLVVTGTNLADVDAVEFGGTAANSFTVDSDTQLTVVTPIGEPGVAELIVSNPLFASESAVFAFIEPMTVGIVDGAGGIEPGSDLEIGGGGFAPNTQVDLELRSTPRPLGTATTDDLGRFTATVTIPSDTDPGPHRVVATGVDPFGAEQSVSLNVEVRAIRQSAVRAEPASSTTEAGPASSTAEAVPSNLASTGRGFGITFRTGLIMLLLGAAMVAAAGRRSTSAVRRR